MAKDLPYFKFFCSEWNDGDITLESWEYQGLFINICSYYWSNECNVSFDKLLKRFRGCEDIINDLNAESLIKITNDRMLSITFLDEQQEERQKTSKKNSEAGKLSALKRWGGKEKVTPVKITLNESVTIKRREEERREDKINKTKEQLFLEDWNELRLKHLKKKTNIKTLSGDDRDNFKELIKSYTREDMQNGLIGLFKQKKLPNDNQVMQSNPKHFLSHFNSYLSAFLDQNQNLYGKEESKQY